MLNKKLKILVSFFIIFFLINMFSCNFVLATGSKSSKTTKTTGTMGPTLLVEKAEEPESEEGSQFWATVAKIIVVSTEIIVAGYFTIILTIRGIQYFTAVAATDKADNKHAITWALIEGVIAITLIRIFARIIGFA